MSDVTTRRPLSEADRSRLQFLNGGPAVYMPLRHWLTRSRYDAALDVLGAFASNTTPERDRETYWRALEARGSGSRQWVGASPIPTPTGTRTADIIAFDRSCYGLPNVVRIWPYIAFEAWSIAFTLDYFNPSDELGLRCAGAGEPVLRLLLLEKEFGAVQDGLLGRPEFFDMVRRLSDAVGATGVCGANPNPFFGLLSSYLTGETATTISPWSFLFHLTLVSTSIQPDELRLPLPAFFGTRGSTFTFSRVDDWGGDRVLLMLRNGLDATVDGALASAARLFGKRAYQEVGW